MTAFTSGVAASRRHACHLSFVASRTECGLRFREREGMGLMTLRAREPAVKLGLRVGQLMTAAARARSLSRMARGGMRIVTAHAAALDVQHGMIRVYIRVTLRAGFSRVAAHVVRGVAADTLIVRWHSACSEYAHFGMAGAARLGRLLLEIVRPVATHARAMSTREQRALRHQRSLLFMALLAG
jgi:hypothetical protein